MAAGSALIVLAHNENELSDWIMKFGCGEEALKADAKQIASTILKLKKNEVLRKTCSTAAREASEYFFDREQNIQKLANLIL